MSFAYSEAMFWLNIAKLDANPGFLQIGDGLKQVFVSRSKECKIRMFYWLLDSEVIWLVNSNAEW